MEVSDPRPGTSPVTVSGGNTHLLNASGECLSIPLLFTPSFGGDTKYLLLEGLDSSMRENTRLIEVNLAYTRAPSRLQALEVLDRECRTQPQGPIRFLRKKVFLASRRSVAKRPVAVFPLLPQMPKLKPPPIWLAI